MIKLKTSADAKKGKLMVMIEQKDISLVKDYKIKSYEVTLNNELKPFALLHYFEDVAYLNAENMGVGHSATSSKDLYWFVVKYHMKFERLPKAWEKIAIKTWARKNSGVQCLREFELYGESGDKIGSASSAWVLVGTETKRPVNPFKTLAFPELPETKALETEFSKIEHINQVDCEKVFDIRFDDIDINRHVNNSNYIAWAGETLPYEFRISHSLCEIEIQYKKESTYGSKILSQLQYQDNSTVHILKDLESGDELCLIKMSWKNLY